MDILKIPAMKEAVESARKIIADSDAKIRSFDHELIQYLVVNKDLIRDYDMSMGKTGAQLAHASRLIALRDQFDEKFKEWMRICMKTIVLGATEKEMWHLLELNTSCIPIIDKGFTEIPPNSLTVVGLPVMERREAKKYIGRFRLL